jgi:hypothetical protein
VSDDPDNTAPSAPSKPSASSPKRVSLSKGAASTPATPAPGTVRPRTVQAAVAAMAASAVAALVAAIALFGQRDWLTREQIKTNNKAIATAVKDATAKAKAAGDSAVDIKAAAAKATADEKKKFPNLHNQISQQQSGALIGTVIVVLALAVLGYAVYRGRHWARWGVVAFWLLASFTGTVVGIGTVLSVGASIPAAFKVPGFLAGAFMILAVVLVNLRSSTSFFALSKPVAAAGAPARRGLFAPRTPPAGGRAGGRGASAVRPGAGRTNAASPLKSNAASRGEAYVERQRSKKRAAANADSVARGAELARSRAKASKSRRIEN